MAGWKLEAQGAMRRGRKGLSQQRSSDSERNGAGRKELKNTGLKLQVLGALRDVCGRKGDRRHSQKRGHSRTSLGLLL